MSLEVTGTVWKYFRELREAALQVLCQRIIDEVGQVSGDTTKTAHERYLAIFKLIRDRDDDIAAAFNNPRRSVFYEQLAWIRFLDLLTDEQWCAFSEPIREHVDMLVEFMNRKRSRKRGRE